MGAHVAATRLDPGRFDEVADRYDETRGGEARGRRQARGLAPMLTRDKLVVDLGTGTGVVAMGLREQGLRVLGVDVAAGMLNRARRRLGTGLIRADAACLPLADGTVPQCLSVWLLHAVPDAGAVLAEVARSLMPGGRYLVLPADGPLDEDADWVTRLLDDLQAQLEARCNGGGGRPAVDLAVLAGRAGLRLVATHKLAAATCEVPAAASALDLERRAYRWLLDVDDGAWQELVAPAIARLRGAGGPPVLRRTRPEVVWILER